MHTKVPAAEVAEAEVAAEAEAIGAWAAAGSSLSSWS